VLTPEQVEAFWRDGGMRSLEALHLASALELGDDLEGIVTYDGRLAAAVAMTGYPVVAPA
jgi:hypothetical protein